MTWRTKPTDRFVLRFIKIHLSAPVSTVLVQVLPDIRPTVLTFVAAFMGVSAGFAFGLGSPFVGGLIGALAQVMDGVDGQVARLTGRESSKGALLDSVLDRYTDFSLLFGIFFYCLRFSVGAHIAGLLLSPARLIIIAGLAAAGSSQVSYATARAASLKLNYRRPEHAGKGSRTAVIILCGILAPAWIHFPLIGLLYLAVHPNVAIFLSLLRLKGNGRAVVSSKR